MDANLSSGSTNQRNGSRLIPLLLVLTGLAAYANSLGNPFVFDDGRVVRSCSRLASLWPLTPRIVADFTFWLNAVLGGLHPAGYRAINIAIHLSAALFLYGIVRRTLRLPRFQRQYDHVAAGLAGVSATLWVVHPLQTESVIYVCQRYESLMGLFYLSSLYCFLRGSTSAMHKRAWYDGAVVSCLLGMGTKGVMMTAPVMILLYDYVFLSEVTLGAVRSRWKVHAALLVTVGAALCLALLYREYGIASYLDPGRMAGYLLTQFRVVACYLRLVAWPYPLCLDYGWRTVGGLREVAVPAATLVVLVGAAIVSLRRRQAPGYLGTWFFAILAPTSSLWPIDDVMVEHRLYLSLAGPIVLAVVLAYRGIDRCGSVARKRHWGAALGVLVIALFAVLTVLRNRDYRSEKSLWSDVVRKQPDNLRARNDLAVALCEEGRFEVAQEHFDYVLDKTADVSRRDQTTGERLPYALANNSAQFNRCRAFANMGVMESVRGRTDSAVSNFVESLRVYPYSPDIQLKLRQSLLRKGVAPHDVQNVTRQLLQEEKD